MRLKDPEKTAKFLTEAGAISPRYLIGALIQELCANEILVSKLAKSIDVPSDKLYKYFIKLDMPIDTLSKIFDVLGLSLMLSTVDKVEIFKQSRK
jgi:DNA-binding phage protein